MSFADVPVLGLISLTLHLAETVAIVVMWLRAPGKDAGEAVRDLAGRVDVLYERISHMPTNEEQAELGGTVREIDAKLDGVTAQQAAMTRQLDRIENWMLNHGSRQA